MHTDAKDGNPVVFHRFLTDPASKTYAAEFRSLGAPEFPSQTFQSGQMIAVDVLVNPATGQKVVDYIQVTYEPFGEVPSKAAPRDFQVADVLLHIVVPSLRDVLAAPAAAAQSGAPEFSFGAVDSVEEFLSHQFRS